MNYESPRYLEPTTFTELTPRPLSEDCERWIAAYKSQFLSKLSLQSGSELPKSLIHQAVHEADALATLTPFPALFLPTLLEEKVALARDWSKRQRRLLGGRQIALAA